MNDASSTPPPTDASPAAAGPGGAAAPGLAHASVHPPAAAPAHPTSPAPLHPTAGPARWLWVALALLGIVAVASAVLAWKADQRGASLEQELVRRQQDSATQSTEARMLAKQAQGGMADAAAKVALLEARVAEVGVQRTQLEELIQSLSRSRDENLLVDVEAGLRVALQQSAITGSAEPLVATLKQSDERLARYNQPRLEGVRRAIARDLDRVKAVSVTDVSTLSIKLDEAIRMVDELPLITQADTRRDGQRDSQRDGQRDGQRNVPANAARPGSAAASGSEASALWPGRLGEWWSGLGQSVWGDVKSLVRISRIDHPDAMLLAPEQAFFLRENLKLRLLNARLALLSRQFDTAQSDLLVAQSALERFFDRSARRTVLASDLVKQVAGQARLVVVPRPDDTLAALTAAGVGR